LVAAMLLQFLKKYNMESSISSYCKIVNNTVELNGEILFKEPSALSSSAFLNHVYKSSGFNYPKYFKMDKLCKLALLASEFAITKGIDTTERDEDNTALVFSNKSSSLESDRKHVESISDKKNYFPSPSVFVYTLPNMLIGEIAIKHKIKGENAFFVSPEFNATILQSYCEMLFTQTQTKLAVCGWVNADGDSVEAFVYCVKKSNFKVSENNYSVPHTAKEIQQLFI